MDIVAVADENPEGLKAAAERLRVRAAYTHWDKMLREVRPEIVVIGPRWVDCHLDMVLAAAEVGASIFMEKPMGRTPAECDTMIAACDQAKVKMVVAHNMRTCPILDVVQEKIAAGIIGDLQEIRCRGKEDRRAGGEDMMVLGTHCFDLMRRFAGDPDWAGARICADGHEITRDDIRHDGPEGMGPIAGDDIAGTFAFQNGINAYFASRKSAETSGKRWGIDLYGSQGFITIRASHVPTVHITESISWQGAQWKPFPLPAGTEPRSNLEANHLLVRDLVDAIEKDREPAAGGRTARWAVEMAMALYEAQRTGSRVNFPLQNRDNPLKSY
jgi:predicted dehydrogenase